MYIFEKQFRLENPQTINEIDKHYDLVNYKDWLEQKLIASNNALNELTIQVTQYSKNDISTKEYFENELKYANCCIIPLM